MAKRQGGNYAASLEVPIAGEAGFSVRFLRGWAAVDAAVEGEIIRFVSTHLERATAPTIQVLQAAELRQLVKRSPHTLPAILHVAACPSASRIFDRPPACSFY